MRSLIVLLAAFLPGVAFTAPLERVPFELPRYEDIRGAARYATAEEYAAAVADGRFELQKVAYTSDGLRVFAYIYGPVKPAGKLPTVVYNRGSWTRAEFAGELLTSFHRLAQAGFLVVAPMYRGSGGNADRDELGGADVSDLMATIALAKEIGHADSGNLFLYGESRGGMMVYQALRDGWPARAAAVYGGFTDFTELVKQVPKFEGAAKMIWPDYEQRRAEIAARRSAVTWAESIKVPLLIMHGGDDGDVPPSQALALASRLEALDRPYELVIRAGANHMLSEWRQERDAQAVEWFRRHLEPQTKN